MLHSEVPRLGPTRRLSTAEDAERERVVAAALGLKWDCTVHSFGYYSPVDWWIERGGRMVAVAELKVRTVPGATYPTVYLAVAKWEALVSFAVNLDVTPLFVVQFTDALVYIDLRDVDARRHIVAGREPRPGTRHDIEPIITVPVADMHRIAG